MVLNIGLPCLVVPPVAHPIDLLPCLVFLHGPQSDGVSAGHQQISFAAAVIEMLELGRIGHILGNATEDLGRRCECHGIGHRKRQDSLAIADQKEVAVAKGMGLQAILRRPTRGLGTTRQSTRLDIDQE